MLMLSSVLTNETSPLHVRNAAGLALKNALSARVRLPPTHSHSPSTQSFFSHREPTILLFFFYPSQDAARQTESSNRWLALNADIKNKIKQQALLTLGSPQAKAGNYSSQVVAAIAAVELPHNQWADLIELLLSFINNQDNANLKIATLQTIGFICEVIVCSLLNLLSFCSSWLIAWRFSFFFSVVFF